MKLKHRGIGTDRIEIEHVSSGRTNEHRDSAGGLTGVNVHSTSYTGYAHPHAAAACMHAGAHGP